tara:strand:+ start:184 stop:750 length:567 start_codon:yes stop_codon:yes gene_type:complete
LNFISGSIPWSFILGKLILKKDIRNFGDQNPGVANLWKAGGWKIGTIGLIFDISKAAIPVYLTINYLKLTNIEFILISIAPILGHAFSPFLKFNGGKSLAASGGVWISISGGIAIPVIMISLLIFHSLQKNHSWTIILTMLSLLTYYLFTNINYNIIFIWFINLIILIIKHRIELNERIIFRNLLARF